MASAQLTTDTKNKVMKIIPMLGSDNAGQVVAAATALVRVLQADGKDLIDLSKALTKKQKEPKSEPTVSAEVKDRAIVNLYRENQSLKTKIQELKSELDEAKEHKVPKINFSPSFFWCLFFFVLYLCK